MAESRTETPSGARTRGVNQGAQGGENRSFSDAADTASEMWDDAYERGERYLRQGSQALGNLDSGTLTGLLVAGAVGFGVAWLLFGQQFRSADDMTRRMSESSDRYGSANNRRSRHH
jgi:hypothetical protein